MAGAQAKQIHGEIAGLSGGLEEIRSRGVGVLECMWVELEAVQIWSALLASTGPEGELVAGPARATGDEGPQRARHSRSLAIA